MNKIYLLTAAFAVMASLSGCSDTELASIDTAQEKTPIGFHTVGSQMGSRATIINSGDITKTNFKVYAFDEDGKAIMGKNDTDDDEYLRNGVHIEYDKTTSAWGYKNSSDLRYWPDSKLDFYAVSPATFPEDIGLFWKINKEKQTITYSSFDEYKKAGGAQNLDVMYAVVKGQTKTNGGKVSLTFKHILSQVLFKAKTNDAKMEVEIKDMQFNNFQLAGTFTIPVGEPQKTDWSQIGSVKAPFTVGMDGNKIVTSTSTEVITKPMLFVPQTLTAWIPVTEKRRKQTTQLLRIRILQSLAELSRMIHIYLAKTVLRLSMYPLVLLGNQASVMSTPWYSVVVIKKMAPLFCSQSILSHR